MKYFMKKAQEAADKFVRLAEEKMDDAKTFFDEATETVKLEWEVAKKKEELNALLLEYGKLCYYEEESEEDFAECRAALIETESAINVLVARIEEIKEEEAKKQAQRLVNKSTVFCTKCGKEYKGGEKFCSKCGNKLNK